MKHKEKERRQRHVRIHQTVREFIARDFAVRTPRRCYVYFASVCVLYEYVVCVCACSPVYSGLTRIHTRPFIAQYTWMCNGNWNETKPNRRMFRLVEQRHAHKHARNSSHITIVSLLIVMLFILRFGFCFSSFFFLVVFGSIRGCVVVIVVCTV